MDVGRVGIRRLADRLDERAPPVGEQQPCGEPGRETLRLSDRIDNR